MNLSRSGALCAAVLAVPLAALGGGAALAERSLPALIGPAELAELLEAGELRVVDIRNEASGYIPGAVAAPYGL